MPWRRASAPDLSLTCRPAAAGEGFGSSRVACQPRHGTTQLHVIDSDGGNARLVSSTLALRGDLAWTPDSQSIVGAIVQAGEPNLSKIPLDGAAPQPMTSDYSLNPVWSP